MKTAPVFRSRADAGATAKIYDRVPVLIEERPKEDGGNVNPWGITFQRMFHMSNDSGLFATAAQLADDGWSPRRTGLGARRRGWPSSGACHSTRPR